jgi:hypothetical protein
MGKALQANKRYSTVIWTLNGSKRVGMGPPTDDVGALVVKRLMGGWRCEFLL